MIYPIVGQYNPHKYYTGQCEHFLNLNCLFQVKLFNKSYVTGWPVILQTAD